MKVKYLFQTLLKTVLGDPYVFRRVDYPGIPDHKLPKTFLAVDLESKELKRRQRLTKRAKHRVSRG